MSCDAPDINRLLASFQHKKTDRVPNFEILIEDRHTSRLLGRTVGHTLGSAKGASEDEYVAPPMDPKDYIEICRLIGQDAVGMEALWAPLKKKGDDGKLHIITDGSVHTWEDLDKVMPHSRELDIEPKRRHLRAYIEACKGTGIGTTIMTCAPIMTPYQFIVGFEEFMMMLYTDQDFVQKVISMCMDYYVDLVRMACQEGVSFIYIGDDIGQKGSLIMGRELSRKWAIPCYARIVQICNEYKVPVAMHSCGNAVAVIPDLIDIGIVMYNPVEPTSGADIYDVHKKYGDKICLSGNIDIAGVLAFGTPEAVAEDVRHHIEALAGDGGYILTTSHSVTNDIPYENFLSMIAAGHRYGQYPLTAGRTARADCHAQGELARILSHTGAERMEKKLFTPETRYGVCKGCGNRAVTYHVPTDEMLCEKCYPAAGWVLVHEGPDMGWHRARAGMINGRSSMKLAIILGNLGNTNDRFLSSGYKDQPTKEEMLKRAAAIEDVEGVELVGSWDITAETVDQVGALLAKHSLKCVSIIPDHFAQKRWGSGAFTSKDSSIRAQAVEETAKMADAAVTLGCDLINLWPGQDGYDYPFQADYRQERLWLEEGVRSLCKSYPRVRFSLEYKPKEPRTHSYMARCGDTLQVAQRVAMPNVGVTIDTGHAFVGGENVAEAAIMLSMAGDKLFHMHFNDNYRFWDDDMIVGSVHFVEFVELLFWLREIGYKGWYSMDQYPYREEAQGALSESIEFLKAIDRKLDAASMEEIRELVRTGEAVKSTRWLRKRFFG